MLPFPKRPRAPAKEPLDSDDVIKSLDRKECISMLETLAPVSKSFQDILRLPETLFQVGEGRSFSSDPDRSISEIAYYLTAGKEISAELLKTTPDYAIEITYRSSTNFCVLLDKKRKILVMQSLGNPLGQELTWDYMARAIEDALRDVSSRRGEDFAFIVNLENITSAI